MAIIKNPGGAIGGGGGGLYLHRIQISTSDMKDEYNNFPIFSLELILPTSTRFTSIGQLINYLYDNNYLSASNPDVIVPRIGTRTIFADSRTAPTGDYDKIVISHCILSRVSSSYFQYLIVGVKYATDGTISQFNGNRSMSFVTSYTPIKLI